MIYVRSFLVLIGLSLLWPAIHSMVFLARFGRLSGDTIVDSAVFIPMGLVAAIAFLLIQSSVTAARQKKALVAGYAAAIPIAYVGSLIGGIVTSAVGGSVALGSGPLLIGMLTGVWLARPKEARTADVETN